MRFPMKTCSVSFSKFADCKPSSAIWCADMSKCQFTLLKCRVDFYKENPVACFAILWISKSVAIASRSCKDYLKASMNGRVRQPMDFPQKTPRVLRSRKRRHAVRWRLAYVLHSPHQLLTVRDAVNLATYELQESTT